MPQVGESNIHFSYDDEIKINADNLKERALFYFSYDDEIKINVENLKERALFLKSLESLSKRKDFYKHVDD